MTKTEITSYCGDVYEKVEGEHTTVYYRVKKAADPSWRRGVRPRTQEEVIDALRTENEQLTAECDKYKTALAWISTREGITQHAPSICEYAAEVLKCPM